MWGKEVFLKKIFDSIIIKQLLLFFFVSTPAISVEINPIREASKYIKNIDEFSSSFLQIKDNDVSEGNIFIKGNRLRIEYTSPSNIIFVLKKNKGMYFNADLQEVQYFNSKNTIAGYILDFFNNEEFLLDAKVIKGKGYYNIIKTIQVDEVIHKINIYFEDMPFRLRKLEILNNEETLTFTILNSNHNPNLNDNIFSLVNPLLS